MNYTDFGSQRSGTSYVRSAVRKRRVKSAVAALAVIVALCTVYWLIIPAVTMESDFKCGIKEHTHTDACYETQDVLVCDLYEHVHTDECYEEETVLVCEDESEEHIHGDDCYETRRVLICDLYEHTHGEDCYDSQSVLTCEKEEHIHSDECRHADEDVGMDIYEDVGEDAEDVTADAEDIAADAEDVDDDTEDVDADADDVGTDDTDDTDDGEEFNEEIGMIPKRGAEDIQTREETTTLTVYKVWSDSWEEHDPITVTLMRKNADGSISSTGRTVTLGADNGWTAAFDGLEIPAEGEEFAYSVVESDCEGYIAQYGEIKPASAQSGPYWVPAAGNAMQSGGSYVFGTVYNNRCYVMNKGSGNTLAAATVTQNPSVVINGVTYSDYLTDVPGTAVFTATASGSGFILRNDSSSQYLNGNSFTAQQSSATPFTLSNRLLSCSRGYIYLNYRYSNASFSLGNQNSASQFTLYELVYPNAASGYETTIKNTRVYPQQGIIDPDPQLHKTIDYLGDGDGNPDTDLSGDDFYRLYLDVIGSHQPVDLLIVADMSASMGYSYSDGMDRQTALDQIVNGTILSGSGAGAVRDTDGIIYNFLSLHPENKAAVIGFAGGYNQTGQTYESTKDAHNPVTLTWTSRDEMPNGGATPADCYARVIRNPDQNGMGTNYTGALMRAGELLSDESVTNDGHIKVMIFLTDGEPNRYINENGVIAADSAPFNNTKNYFVEFIETHPNLITYIIGISPDANSGSAYTLLSSIAQESHQTYYPANDVANLRAALKTIIDRSKFSLVQICDELSAYVEYYAGQPDLKVTRTDADGNVTTVWENGGPTEYNYDNDNNRIIQSVTYQEGDGDPSTGKVMVTFNPDCLLDGENTFVLSYNVKLTEYAKEQFVENGYNAVGDEGTDYGENETSSLQDGFFANENAYITFTAYDIGHKTEYPHPVVQTSAPHLRIYKQSKVGDRPLTNAVFDLYRFCDPQDEGAVEIPGLFGEYGKPVISGLTIISEDGASEELTLLFGDYCLIETSAPPGYSLPTKPMAFTVDDSGVTVIEENRFADNLQAGTTGDDGVLNLTVKNSTSHPLPQTGGIGKQVYVYAGLLLVTASGVFWYVRRRRERRFFKKAS